MERALRTLIEIGGASFATNAVGPELDQLDNLGECGVALREVLLQKDGFFCFESALRIFPSMTTLTSWGLSEWNSNELWKIDYSGLADNYFCFSEDIFGLQFCLSKEGIFVFEPETAEVKKCASTLDEWASKILSDYQFMTGYRFAHEWQELHGPLPTRQRLMPKTPFVLGGEYALANLVATDSVRLMKSMGNLAHQIHGLPDRAQIKFDFSAG